jgi:hypothetical protein
LADSAIFVGAEFGLHGISQPTQALMTPDELTQDAAYQYVVQDDEKIFGREAHLYPDDQGDKPDSPYHHLTHAVRKARPQECAHCAPDKHRGGIDQRVGHPIPRSNDLAFA